MFSEHPSHSCVYLNRGDQPMKEYEFVRVELSTMRRRPKEDYQQIIHDYAKRGWTFVQIFAPSIDGYGAAAYFEIIFERDVEEA